MKSKCIYNDAFIWKQNKIFAKLRWCYVSVQNSSLTLYLTALAYHLTYMQGQHREVGNMSDVSSCSVFLGLLSKSFLFKLTGCRFDSKYKNMDGLNLRSIFHLGEESPRLVYWVIPVELYFIISPSPVINAKLKFYM